VGWVEVVFGEVGEEDIEAFLALAAADDFADAGYYKSRGVMYLMVFGWG
jgi:hypothetical protein